MKVIHSIFNLLLTLSPYLLIALALSACVSQAAPISTPTIAPINMPTTTAKCINNAWSYAENVHTDIEISPDLVIQLSRSECFGECPSYTVTISGDGRVIYWGYQFVPTVGTVEKQIQEDQLQQIVAAFEEANFFAISVGCAEYSVIVMDASALNISISTEGRYHVVAERGACNAYHFDKYCDLGDKIEAILGLPW